MEPLRLLAKKTAVSRTVLVDRFTRLVGQPPMQYLRRMRTAQQLLREGRAKVSEVGYASEAAFSRAFRRGSGRMARDGVVVC